MGFDDLQDLSLSPATFDSLPSGVVKEAEVRGNCVKNWMSSKRDRNAPQFLGVFGYWSWRSPVAFGSKWSIMAY